MSTRILKINAEIQKAVSEIIQQDLQNPNINGLISVVRVDTTADLSLCRLYLSIFGSKDPEAVYKEIQHSAGFIRKELCHRLNLRKVPFLEFLMDETIAYGAKMDKIFEKINEEREENDN